MTDFHYDANLTGAGDGSKSMRSIIVPVSLYYISPLYITTSAAPLAANGTVDIFCVGPDDANKGRYMLVDIKAPLFLF